MEFKNLKTDAGLKQLNEFLQDKSYIAGYEASQSDVAVFEALAGQPGTQYRNAQRWYRHIKTYESEKSRLPGDKTAVKFGSGDAQPAAAAADDDDFDLFGSDDEEDEEAERIKQERLQAYHDKKAKKTAVIAKSSLVLDVKPWDDETDMAELEKHVRSVQMDGLLWGASKLVPVGYGIKKLQISCVIVDDKVSTDDLEELITGNEDLVQSMDIAAFNKV